MAKAKPVENLPPAVPQKPQRPPSLAQRRVVAWHAANPAKVDKPK